MVGVYGELVACVLGFDEIGRLCLYLNIHRSD